MPAKLLHINRTDLGNGFISALSEPGSIWLDSVYGFGDRGHRSVLARRPVLELIVAGKSAFLRCPDRPEERTELPDWLDTARTLWAGNHDMFSVGYISYEAALPFVTGSIPSATANIPEVRFSFYQSVLEVDHLTGCVRATDPEADNYADVLSAGPVGIIQTPDSIDSARLIQALPRRVYEDHVRTIKDLIYEGDIYQANYTTRLDIASEADPVTVYSRLRRLSPSPYGAWLNYGDYQILSSSPERMFLRTGETITTGPIKGTISRGSTEDEDMANLRRLLASEKDRAELLMIVDLARNDLGRIAEVGSIRVDSLFRPERYASVIHLVGDVSARLRQGIDLGDILHALLPGGSITGAPKKRAVEIIRELEPLPRSVYTGCIGYVHGHRADFNIAIRTMVHRDGCYHVHAGGGIVADSEPGAEYDEMRLKAERMLSALGLQKETMVWPE